MSQAFVEKWLPTPQAEKVLGVSRWTLYRMKDDQTFKLGKHYRIISRRDAGRATYHWNPDRCAEVMATPLEKRQ